MKVFTLTRHGDGTSKEGPLSLAGIFDPTDSSFTVVGNRPLVGTQLWVGCPVSKEQSSVEGWVPQSRRTSRVTRILSESPFVVVFATENSIYTWTEQQISPT